MTKTLQSLMRHKQVLVARLNGMKSIIRVESPRRRKWFLVLPAVGNNDGRCIEIRSEVIREEFKGGPIEQSHISAAESEILKEYADRIISTN
jgi:hypothetical protein